MNPKDCGWENHYQIIMKTILQEKDSIHYSIFIGSQIYPYASSQQKIQQQKQQWTRNEKNGENFGVEPDESQKQERGDR